jgi:hypothetical protein
MWAAFNKAIAESGHAVQSGTPMHPDNVAHAIADVLKMSGDGCPDLVEFRGR